MTPAMEQQVETPAPRPLHPREADFVDAKARFDQAGVAVENARQEVEKIRQTRNVLNNDYDRTNDALRKLPATIEAVETAVALMTRLSALDMLSERALQELKDAERRLHFEIEGRQKHGQRVDAARLRLDEWRNT